MHLHTHERTELLEKLAKVQRKIKRRPHLAADAQAILFRLRELRQLARVAQQASASTADPVHPA